MLESTCVGDIMTGTFACTMFIIAVGYMSTHVQTRKVCDLMSRHKHHVCWHPRLNFRTQSSHFHQKSYLCGKLLSDTYILRSPVMRTSNCIAFVFLSIGLSPQPSKPNLLNSDHTLFISGNLLSTLLQCSPVMRTLNHIIFIFPFILVWSRHCQASIKFSFCHV